MVTAPNVDEKKKTAASYIYSFYTEVQLLTHHYANYENLLIELENSHGDEPNQQNISVDEKDILKQYCQTIRYYAIKTHTAYNAIVYGIKQTPDKKINAAYDTIIKQFVISRKDCQQYVTMLNSVLVNTVIKNLLESSQDLVNQLYASEENENV